MTTKLCCYSPDSKEDNQLEVIIKRFVMVSAEVSRRYMKVPTTQGVSVYKMELIDRKA